MTAAEWWARVRRPDARAADVERWCALAPEERRRVLARIKAGLRAGDAETRRRAWRMVEHVTCAEWPRTPGGLSRHLALEVAVARWRGAPLAPGAPVPGCDCETCRPRAPERPRRRKQGGRGIEARRRWEERVERARAVPLLDVAARLGLEVDARRSYARCPFHDDRRPSLHLNASKGRAFCNPCGRSWDALALYMDVRRVTFREAVEELATDLGG